MLVEDVLTNSDSEVESPRHHYPPELIDSTKLPLVLYKGEATKTKTKFVKEVLWVPVQAQSQKVTNDYAPCGTTNQWI